MNSNFWELSLNFDKKFVLDGEENNYHQIGRRQSSLHSPMDYRTQKTPPLVNKKKPGLFKGIGSMFRYIYKTKENFDFSLEFC